MQCPACRREIPDRSAFCTYCGVTTGMAAPMQAPPGYVPDPAGPAPGIVPGGTNPAAVVARIAAMISVIPVFGFAMTVVAATGGIIALLVYRSDPRRGFRGSAIFAIVFSSITSGLYLLLFLLALLNSRAR